MSKRKKSRGSRTKRKSAAAKRADAVLRDYLACLQEHIRAERESREAMGDENPWYQGGSTHAVEQMRQARVFVIEPETWAAWHHAADVYTTETIAKQAWQQPGSTDPLPESETTAHIERITRAGKLVDFPPVEAWPFASMWVGFGPGLRMADWQAATRIGVKGASYLGLTEAHLLGQLFCKGLDGHPMLLEALRVESTYEWPHRTNNLFLHWVYANGAWKEPYSLVPWETNLMFAFLEEFRTVVLEQTWSANARDIQRRASKGADVPMPMPKPYYHLRLRPRVVRERAPSTLRSLPARTWKLDHQVDVMGHERVYVRRGPTPMPDELRAKLLARGYRLYEDSDPTAKDLERLMSRAMEPRRSGEWLAIKDRRIAPHKRGPEGTPYVPAIRIAEGGAQ